MKELFRILAEYSLTGICLIQDDRFQYVKPAMARMLFGYTVEEAVQRKDGSVFLPKYMAVGLSTGAKLP